MCMHLKYKMASTRAPTKKLGAGVRSIYIWQTRSEEYPLEPKSFCYKISSELVVMGSAVSTLWASTASTPNRVLNSSCRVVHVAKPKEGSSGYARLAVGLCLAIPMQNKKEMDYLTARIMKDN